MFQWLLEPASNGLVLIVALLIVVVLYVGFYGD